MKDVVIVIKSDGTELNMTMGMVEELYQNYKRLESENERLREQISQMEVLHDSTSEFLTRKTEEVEELYLKEVEKVDTLEKALKDESEACGKLEAEIERVNKIKQEVKVVEKVVEKKVVNEECEASLKLVLYKIDAMYNAYNKVKTIIKSTMDIAANMVSYTVSLEKALDVNNRLLELSYNVIDNGLDMGVADIRDTENNGEAEVIYFNPAGKLIKKKMSNEKALVFKKPKGSLGMAEVLTNLQDSYNDIINVIDSVER